MNLHVIIGEDDYLVSETAKKIIGDGVGLEVIDSATSSNAELQLRDLCEADASFSTPPFLDPRKVTWWKNVHFLPGGGRRDSSEEVKFALEKFAKKLVSSALPENQHFILSGPRLLRNSILANTLSSAAEMVVFAAEKPWEASKKAVVRAIDRAKEMGLVFAPGVAEIFVDIVGTDARSLNSELGKMRDYLGEGVTTITAADVSEITSQGVGVEPVVWDVTDAIGKRDLNAALIAMRKFELESGFAVMMTTVIEKFFRQLIDMKNGKTEGMTPFALKKNGGFLRNWTLLELRVARMRFFRLREQAVSRSDEVVRPLVLTELVRACRRVGGRR